MVAPEWVVQRFSTRTVPESKVLPIAPMGSPPSAAHTTPWPRPRPSRGLWPEARWSDGAAPRSRPCRTGTAAQELKHSDDRPHAPWFASATPAPSVYPQPQPSGIPADPFSRSPYDTLQPATVDSPETTGRFRARRPCNSVDLNESCT